jgi:hypothetical protein
MCLVGKVPRGVLTEMRLSMLRRLKATPTCILRACKRPFNVNPSTIGSTHATDPRFNMRSHWDATPILEYWRGA